MPDQTTLDTIAQPVFAALSGAIGAAMTAFRRHLLNGALEAVEDLRFFAEPDLERRSPIAIYHSQKLISRQLIQELREYGVPGFPVLFTPFVPLTIFDDGKRSDGSIAGILHVLLAWNVEIID
jgi:hypothetical protein